MKKNKELLKFNKGGQWELLEKAAPGDVNVSSTRSSVNALPTGWSFDHGSGSFHHSSHGIIGTSKHPDGYFEIKHGGRPVGRAASIQEAGGKIKNYIRTLQPQDTGSHAVDPMSLGKDDSHMDLQCSEEKKDA